MWSYVCEGLGKIPMQVILLCISTNVETIQEKFPVTWKPSIKPTLQTCGFLSFEKGEGC